MSGMGRGCAKTRKFEICEGRCSQNVVMQRGFWEGVFHTNKNRNSILVSLAPIEFSHSLGRKRHSVDVGLDVRNAPEADANVEHKELLWCAA